MNNKNAYMRLASILNIVFSSLVLIPFLIASFLFIFQSQLFYQELENSGLPPDYFYIIPYIIAIMIVASSIMLVFAIFTLKYSKLDYHALANKKRFFTAYLIVSSIIILFGIIISYTALIYAITSYMILSDFFLAKTKALRIPQPVSENDRLIIKDALENGVDLNDMAITLEKLQRVEKLKASGQITNEEYEKLREAILNETIQ